jgi:Asp-tRNA(Asn)/Glu-tRNA(Gln) amidotransferase A subunit family amidase
VDRRAFLGRLAALTASATSLEAVWGAAPVAAAVPAPVSTLPWPATQETDPAAMTVLEAATLIREGRLSPVELVQACLDRIQALDPIFLAFNTVTAETALREARAAQDALATGALPALHGIPLALKDNFFTAGVPTTANSHVFRDFVPEYDGEAWARLRAAGAILLGKTQMGPLATSRATTPDGEVTTRSGWAPGDPGVSPGGSSSGSATAVSARMAPCATGTQTGGSITNPAGAQGLTGLKPTMGRVSLRGIIPLTYTRDHPGPIARDARDAALALQVMAGPDAADPRTLGQPPVPDLLAAVRPVETAAGGVRLRWPTRIGVLPGYLDEPTGEPLPEPPADASDDELRRWRFARDRMERNRDAGRFRSEMLETFRGLGAEIVEVPLPEDWAVLTGGAFNNVRLPERAEPFLEHLQRDVRLFGVSLSPWINGLLLPGTEYLRGQRAKLLLLERVLEQVFSVCDVVVQTSPIPFDIIGLPLVSFPVGMRETPAGPLPVGALLGGQPWAEDRLLSLAGAFQEVTDWHRRRPPDPAPSSGPGEGGPGTAGEAPLRLDVLDVLEDCQ